MQKQKIKELGSKIHKTAVEKGWWDEERNPQEVHMLIVTEIAEAVEADRANHYANLEAFTENEAKGIPFRVNFETEIKGCVEVELADAFIRCLDWMHFTNVPPKDMETNVKFSDNFAEQMLYFTLLAGNGLIATLASLIAQYAEEEGIDFLWFVEQKMRYNEGREKKHGGKKY